MDVKTALGILLSVNPLKTVIFNFHYFPFRKAVRLPAFVCWRTKFSKMKGRIILEAETKTGMFRIGSHGLGTQDAFYLRTIWEVQGTLILKGKAGIGRGSRISIGKSGMLTLGDKFIVTGNSAIVCQKEVSFGKECLLSWDILIMDTDFHILRDASGVAANPPSPVHIGDHVWIGCRNTVLKGVTIADGVIISASSTITRDVTEPRCVVGGQGKSLQILRHDVDWDPRQYGETY